MSCCFGNVSTSEVGIIESWGKFSRVTDAGCFCICWPFDSVVGIASLRVQELNVSLETKTKDNVFVNVNVSIQYQVLKDRTYSAYYILSDPHSQMTAYVFDSIRASLCHMTLDQSFESKEEISMSLKTHLGEIMSHYGFTILNALVTDLTPDPVVRDGTISLIVSFYASLYPPYVIAMNEINASKRLKEAAYQRAEGEKILKVKKAEGEAESMYLSGIGVARQRKAIMVGLKDSIVEFQDNVSGTSPKEIMDLLVLTQYFDTLQEMGNGNNKCIFLPSDDGTFRTQLLEAHAAGVP